MGPGSRKRSSSLVLANFLVYRIPPARRALDAEDHDVPGNDYNASQRALIKAGIWIFAVCLPLILAGVLIE